MGGKIPSISMHSKNACCSRRSKQWQCWLWEKCRPVCWTNSSFRRQKPFTSYERSPKKAFKILKDHYRPNGKPRIIALYTELTRLNKNHNESMTDYIIRAETTASSLWDAGETVSDGLLIAMVLKGLPANYKPFATVVSQACQQELSKNSRFL